MNHVHSKEKRISIYQCKYLMGKFLHSQTVVCKGKCAIGDLCFVWEAKNVDKNINPLTFTWCKC